MNTFFICLWIFILGITTINWLLVYNPNTTDIIYNRINDNIDNLLHVSDDDTKFKHNFCESKLQDNKPPEQWNAWTSLIISIVPFIYGFPKYPLLYNVACMLSVNGIASFHYHYYLDWVGKQGDEISMILANYFGLWGLINMYYKKSERRNNLNRYNTAFMYIFLVSNTIIRYDYLFPSIFGIYVGGSLVMIFCVGNKYNIPYIKNLVISFVGASCWIISEHYCNKYTKFGHPIWHLFFPLGFYRLTLDFDVIKHHQDRRPSSLSLLDKIDEDHIL